MNCILSRRIAFLSLLAPFALAAHAQAPIVSSPASYHLLRRLPLPGDGGWDYLALDSRARRIYISRGTHVMVVDEETGKVVGDIPDTAGVHGIAIDPKSGRGFTSNGRANSVTIFDLKTLKKIGDVNVGEGPDCIIFDPATERVFTFNGRAQSATAIDAATGAVAGTVALPGRPEFAVADGRGHIYNNLEDKSEVAAIDSKTLKVENVWPIAPGEGPSGIAMDPVSRRVFSVCDNEKVVVLDADTGKVVAAPTIGKGPDACAFDREAKLVFSPNGEDGTLTLIQEVSRNEFKVVATVPTEAGARTMALDSKTHHVFTVTAKSAPAPEAAPGAAPPGRRRRGYAPDSFVLLEYGP